jgi:hypothetical protein
MLQVTVFYALRVNLSTVGCRLPRLLTCIRVNEFYDKYICLGARHKVALPEAVVGDFLGNLSRNSAVLDIQSLSLLEDALLFTLSTTHVAHFVKSGVSRSLSQSYAG